MSNHDDYLSLYVYKTSLADYNEYVEACKEKGFTVEALKNSLMVLKDLQILLKNMGLSLVFGSNRNLLIQKVSWLKSTLIGYCVL